MHVLRGGSEAKVWLSPVRLESSSGYNPAELAGLVRLARFNEGRLLEVWHAHFGA